MGCPLSAYNRQSVTYSETTGFMGLHNEHNGHWRFQAALLPASMTFNYLRTYIHTYIGIMLCVCAWLARSSFDSLLHHEGMSPCGCGGPTGAVADVGCVEVAAAWLLIMAGL